MTAEQRRGLRERGWRPWTKRSDKSHTGKRGKWSIGGWYWFSPKEALYVEGLTRKNPSVTIKPGKWIKASAVRVRKVAGRVVMDIKKAI